MPDQVSKEIIKELRETINALNAIIKRENKKYLVIIFALIVSSIFISIVSTTAVVSVCFLSGPDDVPGICTTIPGYHDSVENNKKLLKQFEQLQKVTQENQQRIDKLEKRDEQR